jgi:hypothetical protein
MEKRYGVLRFIGTIYKLFGVIVLIIAIVSSLGLCAGALTGASLFTNAARENPFLATAGPVGFVISAIVALIYGVTLGMALFAFGDFISLMLSIEENTRATSSLLRSQATAVVPQPPK